MVRDAFAFLRTPEGERAVLDDNFFVGLAPSGVLRRLTAAELAEITRPYAPAGEDRRPTSTRPRAVPFGDDRSETRQAVERQAEWMANSSVPKLHLVARPGSITLGERAAAISR